VRSLRGALLRDIDGVISELESYADEADIWAAPGAVKNSAGTLALHLAGNLQHYIGAALGSSGYIRDRPAEFAARNVPRSDIIRELGAARAVIADTLTALTPEVLAGSHPDVPVDAELTVERFLTHLSTHLAYHLGQIDYHRRVVTGEAGAPDVQSIRRLDELF
jgi:uncharacterized damage-inducible protein DinB